MEKSELKYRLTSLERWGFREKTPYTVTQLKKIKDSGYNAVFVNGGSGFGPDSISPEMFVKSEVIPNLMPKDIEKHKELIQRRISDTVEARLLPWLMWWGIPGPDESYGTGNSIGTNYLDKQLKSGMHGLLQEESELFGSRDPKSCNWRGNRPLCLSHTKVQLFYKDIAKKLCRDYPEIKGITFFPGDHNPDMCDQTCVRCSRAESRWQIYVNHLNMMADVFEELGVGLKMFCVLWHSTAEPRDWILKKLSHKIGVILTANDIIYQSRRPHVDKPFWSTPAEIIDKRIPRKKMVFEQPWMNIAEIGEIALDNFKTAQNVGREVMALHEFSQAEVYDPVINFPLPSKTITMLQKLHNCGFNGFMDFWGNYGPIEYHVNHVAMRVFFNNPDESKANLLSKTVLDITGNSSETRLGKKLIDLWKKIEDAVDHQAYFTWFQRFNPAIGRVGARGHFYKPLIPNFINLDNRPFALFVQCAKNWMENILLSTFAQSQMEDMRIFSKLANTSNELSEKLKESGNTRAYEYLSRQTLSLKLYTSLLGSIGRMLFAIDYYESQNADELKNCIKDEITARLEQINISRQLEYGINIEIVQGDIALMQQYIESPDFPETSVDSFTVTATNYVN